MTNAPDPSQTGRRTRFRKPAAAVLLTVGVLAAGCGGVSSSTSTNAAKTSTSTGKPAYCSELTSLQQSVKALSNVHVVKNGTKALESAVTQVKNDAAALESAVKGEFSAQTSALKSSVEQLTATTKELTTAPSQATLSKIPAEVSAVSTSVKNFASAASSKCG